MFSIPHRLGLALAATLPAFLAASPAHSALGKARLELLCTPIYAPEGFPCRSTRPGTQLVVRVRDDLPRGAVLRFVPSETRGNSVDIPLAFGPIRRNSDYRITVPAALCAARKDTRFELQVLTGDRSQVEPAGDFTALC